MSADIKKVTIEEFSEFLSDRNIGRECKSCGEALMQVSMQLDSKGKEFLRVIEMPIASSTSTIFPIYMRICANCSHIEQFGAVLAFDMIKKKRTNKEMIKNEA